MKECIYSCDKCGARLNIKPPRHFRRAIVNVGDSVFCVLSQIEWLDSPGIKPRTCFACGEEILREGCEQTLATIKDYAKRNQK